MTVSKVKYLNSNVESFEAIFTYNLDDSPSLSVTSEEFSVTAEGTDIFDSFDKIRNKLENITFICFGAHKYCYPSGMCRSMGNGLLVYYLEMGIKPDRNSIRRIFDFNENESEALCVPTSHEQKVYLDEWLKSC
ncbi:hypothetical protein ACMXYV_08130 [Neptuniibacter sp. SY11_33]|uniref:hypothetical protein n=1 Tax=unclassified Neptuniibacter TaxID=2630693 RepID=UPI0039F64922